MNGSGSGRFWIIIAFFALLSLSAGTSFPENYFDEPLPRGVSALQAIVSTVGTKPFGDVGGAFFFGLIGVIIAWLSYRQVDKGNKDTKNQSYQGLSTHDLTPTEEGEDSPQSGFGRKRVMAASPQPSPDQSDASLDELLAVINQKREAGPVPAWAMLLRSPYQSWTDATSWLGGQPKVPSGFVWPREADGKPQTFLAQIDVGSLEADPETGEPHFNLPDGGALLIFVGTGQTAHILSASEMASAKMISPPDDLPTLREYGYFGKGDAFTHWPVDLVAFTSDIADKDEQALLTLGYRPPIFPDRFSDPLNWISNWAIAALEAEVVITSLENEMRQAEWHRDYWARQQRDGASLPSDRVQESKSYHYGMMLADGPDLIAAMKAWFDHASAQHPESGVDKVMLAEIFTRRLAFRNRMKDSYTPMHTLPGSAEQVWDKIYPRGQDRSFVESLRALPCQYKDFIEAKITDWRNHRLFGIEPPFPNNGEDLRGWSSLISVSADSLLGTQSEHDYGMSVWVKKEHLSSGNFANGQLIRHCAV